MPGGRWAGSSFRIFELSWAEAEGTRNSLGIQAAVVGAAFVIFIVPLQMFGKDLRVRQGKVKF